MRLCVSRLQESLRETDLGTMALGALEGLGLIAALQMPIALVIEHKEVFGFALAT